MAATGRNWIPWVVAIALTVWGAWSYASRIEFEKKARSAERFSRERAKVIAALDDELLRLVTKAARRDTVILERVKEVRRVDSLNPPPDAARANLAVRDSLIADQAGQIVNHRQQLALLTAKTVALELARDTLAAALAARPKGLLRLPFLEIGRPALGPFVGVGLDGSAQAGIGIVVSIRLGGG